jgi:hypothetical protein
MTEKTYRGVPGDPPKVTVNGRKLANPIVDGVGFDWGSLAPGGDAAVYRRRAMTVTRLALAICADLMGIDEGRKVYMRIRQRIVETWPSHAPWSITSRELLAHVEDMRRVQTEYEVERRRVNLEPAPVVFEGGGGVGWDSHGEQERKN